MLGLLHQRELALMLLRDPFLYKRTPAKASTPATIVEILVSLQEANEMKSCRVLKDGRKTGNLECNMASGPEETAPTYLCKGLTQMLGCWLQLTGYLEKVVFHPRLL